MATESIGGSSLRIGLQQFKYEEPAITSKPNGKPIMRSMDFGLPKFEIGFAPENVTTDISNSPFRCGVYFGLPRYPIELKQCGHIFCKLCILRAAAPYSVGGPQCPYCKRPCNCSRDVIDFANGSMALQHMYLSFEVRCYYGCGHISTPTAMLEHETWQCPQRRVGCLNDGCSTILPDVQMEAHLDTCPKRFVYCNSCLLPKRFDTAQHNCVNTCSETLRGMHASIIFYKYLYFQYFP